MHYANYFAVARIPTLAPHFGTIAVGPFNQETQMVPIIGLDNTDSSESPDIVSTKPNLLVGEGAFATYQPARLVKAIAGKLGIKGQYYKFLSTIEHSTDNF